MRIEINSKKESSLKAKILIFLAASALVVAAFAHPVANGKRELPKPKETEAPKVCKDGKKCEQPNKELAPISEP